MQKPNPEGPDTISLQKENSQPEAVKKKSILRAAAREQGFGLFGVARPDPAAHAEDFLRWLEEGNHADMEWMRRSAEKRTDPSLVLPGVKSIVLLGFNYFQGDHPQNEAPRPGATGKFARYARGLDYHDLLKPRAKILVDLLASWGGEQKFYADTGPVLEREYAALAGLGWQGKSTVLINRNLGKWFFLAEILTTVELPSDTPEKNHCGKCTRCIEACPTNAIVAPYKLDARRCISYLTIEHKGSIPEELREAVGDRIFGCDDCLDACPWNRFAKISSEAHFQATKATTGYTLREYLEMTDEEFRRMFQGSPVKRTKLERFQRNVCVALGNTGDPRDLPSLENMCNHSSALLREHASWAIAQINKRHPDHPSATAG